MTRCEHIISVYTVYIYNYIHSTIGYLYPLYILGYQSFLRQGFLLYSILFFYTIAVVIAPRPLKKNSHGAFHLKGQCSAISYHPFLIIFFPILLPLHFFSSLSFSPFLFPLSLSPLPPLTLPIFLYSAILRLQYQDPNPDLPARIWGWTTHRRSKMSRIPAPHQETSQLLEPREGN